MSLWSPVCLLMAALRGSFCTYDCPRHWQGVRLLQTYLLVEKLSIPRWAALQSLTAVSGGRANIRMCLDLLFQGSVFFFSISQSVNTGGERILVLLYSSSNKTVGLFQLPSKSQSLQAQNNFQLCSD